MARLGRQLKLFWLSENFEKVDFLLMCSKILTDTHLDFTAPVRFSRNADFINHSERARNIRNTIVKVFNDSDRLRVSIMESNRRICCEIIYLTDYIVHKICFD